MRLFFLSLFAVAAAAAAPPVEDDPYLWLEDVSGARAMAWVAAHNAQTQRVLEADPRYQAYYDEALALTQAEDRIPSGRFLGGQVYDFRQDAGHVRGIFRRASLAEFRKEQPAWRTLLDLDALAARDRASWVWEGIACARPAERRCLVSLSDGGEDAVAIREFDLAAGRFVDGGFVLPNGKQEAAWEDEDSLLVCREWKPGEVGRTGYPYIVKRLKRGQPLSAAVEIFRGSPEDGGFGVSPSVLRDAQGRTLTVLTRWLDTFSAETYILGPRGAERVAIPAKASLSQLVGGRVIVTTHEDWRPAGSGTTFPAGALLSLDLAQLKADPAHPRPSLVYAPAPREALEDVAASKDVLLLDILDNVRGRILALAPGPRGTWRRSALPLPDNSTVEIVDASHAGDQAFVSVTNFLTPPSLWLADTATGSARQIKAQPPKFDASNLVAEQHEAVSPDGTRIPYFLVHRRDMKLDGANPTLLYAYGGFELNRTPTYSASLGKLWLERGGVYALANIRGGGEFGPKWHEAGLGTKRQVVYDDFAAVGRDLIARHVTSPRRLGIKGESNGGLLTGVALIQHPELWHAALINVPLLDMIRISKIAAGASWEGEYGSVEDPAVRAFWEKTSPYRNLRRGTAYPSPFLFTSTADDRVGPQHARKFAARMEEFGLPFFYYENVEGGHAASANLRQAAHIQALQMIYLTRMLMDTRRP